MVFPSILYMGIFWAIIGLISTERLGRVLKETGENLLKWYGDF